MLRGAIKLNIYAKRYSLLRANVFRCCNQKELYQNKCDSIDVKESGNLGKEVFGDDSPTQRRRFLCVTERAIVKLQMYSYHSFTISCIFETIVQYEAKRRK